MHRLRFGAQVVFSGILLAGSALAGQTGAGAAAPNRLQLTAGRVVVLDRLATPAGSGEVVLRPGEIRTFIERYTVTTTVASQLVAVVADPQLPPFVSFAFNGGTLLGQQVTVQYRLEVDDDAPGGSYPSQIGYDFLDVFQSVLDHRESQFTLVIDAPPPPDDHGDDCDSATPVGLDSQTEGTLAVGGDTDYFRVTLAEAGTLTVSTTGSTDTTGTLLSADCTAEESDDDSGEGLNFSITRLLDPGVYHVAVAHANPLEGGDYTLNVQFVVLDPFVYSIHFPQFADGGGLTSQLELVSLGPVTANAIIELRGDDGEPLDLNLSSPAGVGESSLAVPGDGLAVVQTQGVGDPVAGSVTVRSDQPLAGALVFGGEFGLAGVQSSPPLEGAFLAPVETGGSAQSNTGVAVQNLEDEGINLQARLISDSGSLLATSSTFTLPARGHRSIFVDQFEWDNAIDFASGLRAILRIESMGGRFTGTVLLVRPGQLASLPVIVADNP